MTAYSSPANRAYLRRRGIGCTIPDKADQVRRVCGNGQPSRHRAACRARCGTGSGATSLVGKGRVGRLLEVQESCGAPRCTAGACVMASAIASLNDRRAQRPPAGLLTRLSGRSIVSRAG